MWSILHSTGASEDDDEEALHADASSALAVGSEISQRAIM